MMNLPDDITSGSRTGQIDAITLDVIELSDPNKTREKFIEEQAEFGMIPDYPKPRELQVDIDTEVHYEIFVRTIGILQREYPDVTFKEEVSSSGLPHRHIRVYLAWDVTDMERIAWQGALGSDPVRELLSCIRCLRGDKQPTMMIEKDLSK